MSVQPAPLFYSATDDFREEDDIEEHEREVADFYALQRSRRHFEESRATDSSDEEDSRAREDLGGHSSRRGRSIKSSWRGHKSDVGVKEAKRGSSGAQTEESQGGSRGKAPLVDVELASSPARTTADSFDVEPSSPDGHPPPFQRFRTPLVPEGSPFLHQSAFLPRETDSETVKNRPRPPSPDGDSVPAELTVAISELPRHDPFWATLYLICIVSVFASSLLVYLHTSAPSSKHPLGDTIYSTLHSSFYLLAVDTLISIVVAVLWLAVLRNYVRPLVFTILAAVPTMLFSFSLYPLVSSYKGSWHGSSVQDRAMRWLSLIPCICAVIWTYTVYRGRHSLGRATEILEFACRILTANPHLLTVGFATLTAVVSWTWIWMLLFTRVFLGGHLSSSKALFIIDPSTWWLGIFYVLIYLWTLAVLSGIQRATTGATVSQWYFHRLTVPAPSARLVVLASVNHATSTVFGTICLSTLLALMIRLPLLILPRRLTGLVGICVYSLVPTSVAILTNPLALTYAAIHSQPLGVSARGLANLSFVSATSPTTTLAPSCFPSSTNNRLANQQPASLLPYRLAKLLLHSTRFITSLALGFVGWVSTAHMLQISGATWRGSLYAYVVGLLAGAIGWAVLGAMEGVLGGILDAVVVCWGSETGGNSGVEARYCREAGELFGDSAAGERSGAMV